MINLFIILILGSLLIYSDLLLRKYEKRIQELQVEYEQLKKYTDTKNTHPILQAQVDTMDKILKKLKGERTC